MIIKGKDKGKKGTIVRVLRKKNKVIIEGLNLVKKAVKRTPKSKGTIVDKESPLHVSRVALLDPVDGKPAKIKWGFLPPTQRGVGEMSPKGKVRISKRSGTIIPRPKILTKLRRKKRGGSKDTHQTEMVKQTYESPFKEVLADWYPFSSKLIIPPPFKKRDAPAAAGSAALPADAAAAAAAPQEAATEVPVAQPSTADVDAAAVYKHNNSNNYAWSSCGYRFKICLTGCFHGLFVSVHEW